MNIPAVPQRVFVSYASQDRFVADQLVTALENAGIACWIAPRDVAAGRPYTECIMEAIHGTQVMLLVFTSHVSLSPHVLREVERFVSLKRPILSLRIENVLPSGSFEYLISATHWADAVGMDNHSYCALAVDRVKPLLDGRADGAAKGEIRLGGAAGTFTPSALTVKQSATPVVAVLPLENQTGGSTWQYLCDGIAEDVLMRLAQRQDVKVVSAQAVSLLKRQGASAQDIAERLKADWLLEGSVQGDGQRFRLRARLVEVQSQSVQWAQAFDFDSSRLFQTQEFLSEQIVQGMGVRLRSAAVPTETAGQTQNSDALDLYFRARFQTARRSRESLEQAIALYRQAVERDPGFVRAWARLSEVYTLCANYGFTIDESPGTKALELAQHAVSLDEAVPEAQVALGLSLRTSHFKNSADRFRLALSLYPSNVEAHHYLAHVLVTMGEYEEAKAETLKALALDPLYVIGRAHLIRILIYTGRRDEAMVQLAVMEQDGLSPLQVSSNRGWLLWITGDYDGAESELQRTIISGSDNVFDADICADCVHRQGRAAVALEIVESALGHHGRVHPLLARASRICAALGKSEQASEYLAEAISSLEAQSAGWLDPRSAIYWYNRAWVEAVAGDVDGAAASLEQAFASGFGHYAEILLRPDWETVREHDRITVLVERQRKSISS